jgi:hypothetical protein
MSTSILLLHSGRLGLESVFGDARRNAHWEGAGMAEQRPKTPDPRTANFFTRVPIPRRSVFLAAGIRPNPGESCGIQRNPTTTGPDLQGAFHFPHADPSVSELYVYGQGTMSTIRIFSGFREKN